MTAADLTRLAATVFVAVTFVVIGDTAGKLLTAAGTAPAFVAWTRFALAAIVLAPLSGLRLAELRICLDWRVLFRAGLIACGIVCILTALATEPIANVIGAFFVGPIVAYVLAILVLGERPTRGRSLALGIGLLGVLLVVKPGFGATIGMGFALAAGAFYGAYLVATRALAGAYRPRLLLFSQLLIGAVILAPFGVSAGAPTLTPPVLALLVLSAFGSALGNYLLVIAHKRAEASLIAPLVYTQLISATVIGVLVFGEWPDALTFLGLALIAASGAASLALNRATVADRA